MVHITRIALILSVLIWSNIGNCDAQFVSNWTNPNGGDWAEASNWSTASSPDNGQPNPGDLYEAVIGLSLGSDYIVGISGSPSLERLTIESEFAELNLMNGSLLYVTEAIDLRSGNFRIGERSHVRTPEINNTGGTIWFTPESQYDPSVIHEAKVTSNLWLGNSTHVSFRDGARPAGIVTMEGQSRFDFESVVGVPSNVVVGDDTTFVLRDNSSIVANYDIDLILGPSTKVLGSGHIRTDQGARDGVASITNQGFIIANISGEEMLLEVDRGYNHRSRIVNEGTLRAINGGILAVSTVIARDRGQFLNAEAGVIQVLEDSILRLGHDWRNEGSIILRGGTISIEEEFTTSDIGTIHRSGDSKIVFNGGEWDNTGSHYELNETTGDFIIESGTIKGGSITQAENELQIEYAVFDDVEMRGGIRLNQEDAWLILQGSTKIIGDVTITGANSKFIMSDTDVDISEVKTFELDNGGGIVFNPRNAELVFGTDALVHGNGRIDASSAANSNVKNLGAWRSDTTGDKLVVRGNRDGEVHNSGHILATGGGQLEVLGTRFVNDIDGVIDIEEGSRFVNGNASVPGSKFLNNGTINLKSGGTIQIYRLNLSDLGTFNRADDSDFILSREIDLEGGTLDVGGDITLSGLHGPIVMNGTIDQEGFGKLIFTPGFGVPKFKDVAIYGTLDFSQDGTRSEVSGVSDIHGDIEITGQDSYLWFRDGITLAGNKTINMGESGSLVASDDGVVSIAEGTTIQGSGTLLVEKDYNSIAMFANSGTIQATSLGESLSIVGNSRHSPSIVNQGLVQAISGGEIRLVNEYTQLENGMTFVNDGRITAVDTILDIQGGTIGGHGTIVGDVLLNGDLTPGVVTGTLDLQGSLTVTSQGQLSFDLGGTNQGSQIDGYDLLSMNGDLSLDGELVVNVIGDFGDFLQESDEFTIVSLLGGTGSLTGSFSNAENGEYLLTDDHQFRFQVHYGIGSAFGDERIVVNNFITAVPEPTTFSLLSVLGLAFLGRRKKRCPAQI